MKQLTNKNGTRKPSGTGVQLTSSNKPLNTQKGSILTDRRSAYFKICLETRLDSKYNFSKMNQSGLKELDNFICETVDKNLTITEVENLFLRTKSNPFEKEIIDGKEQKIIHFGKDRKAFRIFGFYNEDDEFVIYQLDPKHKKHKSS